ncbi:MAG: hypothetical protein ACK5RL_17140 [Acidimicrobiales bacterium]
MNTTAPGYFGLGEMTDAHHALLGVGEEPLAFESMQMMGADLTGVSRKPRIFGGWSWSLFDGGIQPDTEAVNMWLVGVGAEGPVGSIAQHFTTACNGTSRLLLTTTRLIVTDPTEGGIKFELALSDVARVRRDWRLFQSGRIEITFADGSIARPTMGLVLTRARNRFIRAADRE